MDSQPNIFEPAVTAEEWQRVPSDIGQKLVNFVNGKFEEFITCKALLETKSFNSEQLSTEVKAQIETIRGENENLKSRLAAAAASINEFESQITTMSSELARLQTYSNKLEADAANYRHQRDLAVDERDECFKMTERRKAELERMQMDLDTLTKQLEDATRTKCEALAHAEEVNSMKVSLEYREKRMQQDQEQMQRNLDGVTSDLRERTEELLNLRRDNSSRNLQLETKMSEKIQELAVAVDQCNSLLDLNQTLTTRNEELAQKLLHLNETHAKTNESYVCEIEAKTKMANVYRAMSEQSQKHAEELQTALTEVQELLNLNTEKYGELETKLKESELSCEEIVAKKNDYIAMLTKELETANEVIEECKNESLSRDIEGISTMAANVSRGLANDSTGRTMSYTSLYSQYVQAKEQLATKDEECSRLNNYIACIVKEVEEKGPLIKQLRSEYSDCLDMQEALKSENESLTSELEQLREERAENHRLESKVARENQRMKKEVADLSRQVVHLLQEVEHSRIGSSSALSSDNDMSDSVCSADIISKRLVTFNDIAELQSTNQKLLALVRELTERQEEVESYDPAAVANLQQKLKELQESQMELLEEREQQAKMMTMLRNQRDMYKKSFGHDMIGAGGDLSDRSFSNMPHQDDSIVTKSSQSDSKADEDVHVLKQQIEKYKKQLAQAREEYDQYRKERLEHEKIILEQIETIRNESKELQKANGKLASQAEYNEERFKVLQNNTEVYKKQIQALEKQNKIYTEALIKHEHSASYLKEDALQNQSKASKAEVQLANLMKENAMLRDAEKRLTRESEMLRRHAQQQNLITSNIELIKATLERNEAESKIRLESKLDEAHLECSALRRRLEEEQNHFRELTQHLEKATKHAQERMEENKNEADKLRQELTETRQELSNKTTHIENLSKQLKSSVFQIQDVSVESRKLREIEQQLADSQAEVNALKLKLKSTKEASENYFNIAQNAEKQLKDLSVENEKYVQTLTEKEQQVQRLTDKVAELQAELSIQMDDQDINSADIKNQKQQLQEELQGQSLTLKQTREQLELAKSDLKLLSEQLKASDHKYAREVALHSSDLQLLQDLKQELQAAKDSYRVMELRATEAEETLKENLLSRDEQMAILNTEREKMEIRFKNIDEQNTLLLDQIEALNKQLTIIQGQADHNSSANSSLIEDSANSNQLLTILKYLRQEKDLAVSKADVVEAEHFRLKSQFEAVKNQLEEAQSLYEAERQKSEVKNVTAAKHAEVLRQLETFNAVADSNRSLRQERDALANDIRELQARAEQLEITVAPLQENNRDLMQKADQMQTENISLRAECTRWRQRANLLIEKTNRTSPEDWKKLQTERETLAKQLTIERGNNAKLTEENSTLKVRLDKMEQEVRSLKAQNHGLVEEVSRLKEQVAILGSNLKQVQEHRDEVNKTNAKLTEDNRVFSEELTVKETSITELKNNLAQVKKIAKKYKTQYEEQVKEIEVMKEQQSEQMLTKEKQLELEKAGLEGRISQLEVSHKEALEQLRIDKEQQEQNFIKEMEAQKQSSQEKEDKFKSLFKSAKERIVTLTEQNTALLKEVDKQEKNSTMTSTSSSSNTVGVSVNTDGNKDGDLMDKIQQLEQEKEELQEKLQQEKVARAQELEALKLKPSSGSSALMSSDKSSMERPTADIKPIPGHSTNTQTQSVPIQPWRSVGEPPLASIRPMSQQLRTAAVLPTTQTPSAAVMVPPQQQVHTTGSSSIEALSSSSPTSSHTDYVPATSSASSPMLNPRQVAVPPTQSSEDDDSNMQVQPAPTQQQALAVVSPRVEPPSSGSGGATQEQGTSSSSSNTVTTTQAGLKRQRDTDTDSCQAEEKNAIKQQSKRTRLQQASDSGLEVEYQVPTSSQRDQDDDNVIVLESDDEAGPDEGECDDQDEPDEAEVYDDMEEGMEQDNYDDDEDCQDVEDEEEADNEVEVISDSSEVPNQSHGETEEAREAAENSLDEEQAQSEAISSGTDAGAGPSSSFSPAVSASPPFSRSRLVPPLHRHQNLLDESALDDGIVPSTPTLFAPRRSDGFGEAVSSPHVPSSATGRFTFNESQLAQPSRGGGDYSNSEVPQVDNVDNSTGRSVPTTPLQSSPQESIPNLIDEHGGDGQAQSDAEIPQISISTEEEEGRGEGSSAEVMMGPPSQAGTSSEEIRQENEVEVEDAVSSEGEKQPQAEEGEEEGREAEASPSPNEVTRSSRSSARRSARIYPGSRGPQRMGPTPIVWADHRHPPHRHQQQHERNRSPNYGSGGGRSMARRPRSRMHRPPFGGRF